MKKFVLAVVAAFMLGAPVLAAENVVVADNNATVLSSDNVIDRFIALINKFVKQIDAADTLEKLEKLSYKCSEEILSFTEKYMDEIVALEERLTEKEYEKYEAELDKAMKKFEDAVTKKMEQFLGE